MKLKTIIRPRQAGKTTELIKMSAETGYPIVVKSITDGKHIKRIAKGMDLIIPEPISIVSVMRGNDQKFDGTHILIDDADEIILYIMKKMLKCDVVALAMATRNEKGHEVSVYGEDFNEKYGLPD